MIRSVRPASPIAKRILNVISSRVATLAFNPADPLVVQVLDSGRAPVAGTPVQFSFVGDPTGAVLQPVSAETDSTGQVSAFVRLGTESGEQEIVARVAGAASPDLSASFTVTALSDQGGGGKGKGGKQGGEGD